MDRYTPEHLRRYIAAARKEIPADLVLKGGRVFNVFTGEAPVVNVAVLDGRVVGTGSYDQARDVIDVRGTWIIPGLIDAHYHVESSMLSPPELANALSPYGTTTLVSDPHEIANVLGLEGIRFMIRESRGLPVDFFFTLPSCVPATHMETSGATLGASDLAELMGDPSVVGLAEMMNFPGVLSGKEEPLEKISLFGSMVLDGHCPSLSGPDLQAYVCAGIRSEHETTNRAECLEKLENGMMIMLREGSSAKNLEELIPLVNSSNERRFCLVSDDLHPEDIMDRGHMDYLLRKAVGLGLNPVSAVRMATQNPSEYFSFKDRGAVAPGYRADLVMVDNLESFRVRAVFKNGNLVAENGHPKDPPPGLRHTGPVRGSRPLEIAAFGAGELRIPHRGGRARIIELVPDQIVTKLRLEEVESVDGLVDPDISRDILKLCVVERHVKSGRVGLGLVRGFGLKSGAMASSVAHDSHNVIAVGAADGDIVTAVNALKEMGGGFAVANRGSLAARVPLETGGLMSRRTLPVLVDQLRGVKKAVVELGCRIREPFMALSFLALPVIPEIKLTDMGLVDVAHFKTVPLFEGDLSFKRPEK